MGSHRVVMSKAEILKFIVMVACVLGFGFVGVIFGVVAVMIATGEWWHQGAMAVLAVIFGCIGAALGGYVGYKITRKFK